MKLENFQSGNYSPQKDFKCFIPSKINVEWTWEDSELNTLLEQANMSLGSLDSYSDLIPNIDVYIRLHLKTEAHKSSKIEGTKTTIEEDVMKVDDVSPEKKDDRIEVENYIHAINFGIKQIQEEFPFSTRLIRDIHRVLLQGVRGERKTPGEFRKSQNWIGGSMPSNAVYVPPSHIEIPELMSDLEFFLNNGDVRVPYLIRIALAHYQFESIHPFLDGNGRIGRLMIPLYLLNQQVLSKPCFYISDYFEKNRSEYYDYLTKVRTKNDILSWIKFFLRAVIDTSESAKNKFSQVVRLTNQYRDLEYSVKGRGKNISCILEAFYNDPILSINDLQEKTGLSRTAITSITNELRKENVLREMTGYNRNKLYILYDYFAIFAFES